MNAILLIGEAVGKVSGVNPGMAMAATLACIEANTGIGIEALRRALPARVHAARSMNATQIGRELGVTAREANILLAEHGLRVQNRRWRC